MNVLACVDPLRLGRLRAALAERHRLHVALDWAHAAHLLNHEPVDVLVADPALSGGEAATDAIATLRAAHPSVPVVLYAALTPESAGAFAQLGHAGVETAVLYDADDSTDELLRALERQPGPALTAALLARLAPALEQMPRPVAGAIARAMHTPSAFRGVPDLAAASTVSRRTLYRECERAGLASPREMIAGARVLRAYALLREENRGIEDTAMALRYSSPHHLAKAMRWACGTTTARARAQVPPDAFVARLAAQLMPALPTASSS